MINGVIHQFTTPTAFRPPGEAVPSADELEALQKQLEDLRRQSLDRARKASDDLRTIDEAMRRLKEKEKGKAKAAEKVKRERGCAYKIQPLSVRHADQEYHIPCLFTQRWLFVHCSWSIARVTLREQTGCSGHTLLLYGSNLTFPATALEYQSHLCPSNRRRQDRACHLPTTSSRVLPCLYQPQARSLLTLARRKKQRS